MKHGTTPTLELSLALTPDDLQAVDVALRAGPWEGLPNLVERHWPEEDSVVYDQERKSWMIFLTPEETWRFPQGAKIYLDVRPIRKDGQVPETPLVDLGVMNPSFFRTSGRLETWVEGEPNDQVEVSWKDTHCVVTLHVDDTLTQPGVPADAQAVGNRLTQVEDKTAELEETLSKMDGGSDVQLETGSWSPKVASSNSGGTVTAIYDKQLGTYRKIGDLCYVSAYLRGMVLTSNASAYVTLPFAAKQGSQIDFLTVGLALDATTETPTVMQVDNTDGTAYASLCVAGTSGLEPCTWAMNRKYFKLNFSGCYRVAEE
jgi:hypothetical protein